MSWRKIKMRWQKTWLARRYKRKWGIFFDTWMLDQQVPLQSIYRTQYEYDVNYWALAERYEPELPTDHPVHEYRGLQLAHQPQIVPAPYTYKVNNAAVFRRDVLDPKRPSRVLLEIFPEPTQMEEGLNFTYSPYNFIRLCIKARNNTQDIERGFLFSGLWWNNYYHFVVDYLSRLLEAEECGIIDPGVNLLIQTNTLPFMKEYLELLKIDRGRLVHSGICPITVGELTIVSPRRSRLVPSSNAIKLLRDRMLTATGAKHPTIGQGAKLYVSRQNARLRRIENEHEVIELLRTRGFQIIQAEKLSVAEQVKVFASASTIVAPHGAGLTNLIYSYRPDVVELFPQDDWNRGYFLALTNILGGRHVPVVGNGKSFDHNYTIELNRLDSALDWLERSIEDR